MYNPVTQAVYSYGESIHLQPQNLLLLADITASGSKGIGKKGSPPGLAEIQQQELDIASYTKLRDALTANGVAEGRVNACIKQLQGRMTGLKHIVERNPSQRELWNALASEANKQRPKVWLLTKEEQQQVFQRAVYERHHIPEAELQGESNEEKVLQIRCRAHYDELESFGGHVQELTLAPVEYIKEQLPQEIAKEICVTSLSVRDNQTIVEIEISRDLADVTMRLLGAKGFFPEPLRNGQQHDSYSIAFTGQLSAESRSRMFSACASQAVLTPARTLRLYGVRFRKEEAPQIRQLGLTPMTDKGKTDAQELAELKREVETLKHNQSRQDGEIQQLQLLETRLLGEISTAIKSAVNSIQAGTKSESSSSTTPIEVIRARSQERAKMQLDKGTSFIREMNLGKKAVETERPAPVYIGGQPCNGEFQPVRLLPLPPIPQQELQGSIGTHYLLPDGRTTQSHVAQPSTQLLG